MPPDLGTIIMSTRYSSGARSRPEYGNKMKGRVVTIAIPLLLAIIVIRAFGDPVPKARLQQLREGMTEEQVRAILGEPTKRYDHGQWTYKRFLVFGYVNIHWQEDGTFDGYANYERF